MGGAGRPGGLVEPAAAGAVRGPGPRAGPAGCGAGRAGRGVQAVHGLGGVGKSTLAARWAAAHAADYLVTWWITAATPADIDAGLAALAVALQDVLDPAEAQALLAAILAPDRPQEADGAAGLCAELGFLPLAIEQAGAYLAQAGATPREYLGLLARYPAAMYQAAPEGGDAARTIARIWRVTVDRLADDPLAGQVLRILAWYAPDAIPRTLLDGLADPPAVLRAGRRGHPGHAPSGAGRDPQAPDQGCRSLADAVKYAAAPVSVGHGHPRREGQR